MNKNEFLASVIKKTRLSLNKTQDEFGQMFTPPAAKSIVSRWEKGSSIPSNDRLNLISKLSGYSITELLNGTLAKEIMELIIFSLFKYDRNEKLDTNNMSVEEIQFMDDIKLVNLYSIHDSVRSFPKNISNDSYKELKNIEFQGIDKLGDVRIKEQVNYYFEETFKRAKGRLLNANDKTDIMEILKDVVTKHILGESPNNNGFIQFTINKLETLQMDLVNFIYDLDSENDEKIANVDDNVEKIVQKTIDDAIKKIIHLEKND